MSVEPMTLSTYVNWLQKQLLVTLTQDRADARAKVIRPTEKGRLVFEQVGPIAKKPL
jgi:DNA-binding MarR family transcriptional regulator